MKNKIDRNSIPLLSSLGAVLFISAIFFSPASFADSLFREIWSGTFHQVKPMSWEGPMELYLRFDPEAQDPVAVTGVLTWPTLGGAKTEIRGTLTERTKLHFSEDSCLGDDCTKVVLGGSYDCDIDLRKESLSGQAFGNGGLAGSFDLKRQAVR